jgi:hypothetical protein
MLLYNCKDKLASSINHEMKGRNTMKVIAKYVTVEAVKIGAEIPHDFMLDGDEFTNQYKESEVKDND